MLIELFEDVYSNNPSNKADKSISISCHCHKKGKYILRFTFIEVNSKFFQSLHIGTGEFRGKLKLNGKDELNVSSHVFANHVFWQATAPKQFDLEVELEDGYLFIYNGSDQHSTQVAATTFMYGCGIKFEKLSENKLRFHCNDHEEDDDFNDLIFDMEVLDVDAKTDGFVIKSIMYPYYVRDAIKVIEDEHTMQDYAEYIKKNKIEKAEIVHKDLSVLKHSKRLRYLKVQVGNCDISPLYEMPIIKHLEYISLDNTVDNIDFSKIYGLERLKFSMSKGTKKFDKIKGLKTLQISEFKSETRNLTDLFCSKKLETLVLDKSNIYTLDGIEISKKIQCLYLYDNKLLYDISQLEKVKKTLKLLRISNCSKIKDFSVLEKLENLVMLELSGKNEIDSLKFIHKLKNLKTLTFSINILDGDLTPCDMLENASCQKRRRHYKGGYLGFVKGRFIKGNEDIELSRRLE